MVAYIGVTHGICFAVPHALYLDLEVCSRSGTKYSCVLLRVHLKASGRL